jgi:glutamate/tyrosine decarboxylase-like PLP-dependent enzyme
MTVPQVILPETAHPAFRKGAHLFGMEVIDAPIDPVSTQVDVDFVRKHITDRTAVLVGSACNYGYGTIDPIAQLSDLAVEHGIGLHVDGCLGGFILPWGEQLGYDIPVFDFRLPGVTSISADTHKYGYAPKGTSVLACRDRSLRNYACYTQAHWPGGKYLSPGIAGSRSGGLLAATWASMMSLGRGDICVTPKPSSRRPSPCRKPSAVTPSCAFSGSRRSASHSCRMSSTSTMSTIS